MRSYMPYLVLAFLCCVASVLIVFITMMALGHGGTISDQGMFAIAFMALAPAAIGAGIAPHLPHDRD